MAEAVKVIVRARPLNRRELDRNCNKCVEVNVNDFSVTLKRGDGEPPKTFTFDGVYDEDSLQRDVYREAASPLVDSVLEGYNATIFAYGQTGCGKTFTMEGVLGNDDLQGIIPQSFRHIFDSISLSDHKQKQYLVRVAYLEIYNEEVRDLLSDTPRKSLQLKEDKERGVFVQGLTQTVVKDVTATLRLMAAGNHNRTTGATAMNADSSRSHSIFMLMVETSEPNETTGETSFRAGKLNLVDLAGSERQSKTQATGDRLKEANQINLSLSALGNVISALVAGKGKHVPYRDSKLTRLLQDSLGGNTKTTMVAAISPADDNYDETLSTLRYANRAKNIKNKPKINEDPKDTLLREYQEEIQRLRQIVEAQMRGLAVDPRLLREEERQQEAGARLQVSSGGDVRAVDPLSSSAAGRRRGRDDGDDGNNENGDDVDAYEGEGGQPASPQSPTDREAEALRERLALQEAQLAQQRLMSDQERATLAQAAAELENVAERERQEREALQAKLKALEGQLLAAASSSTGGAGSGQDDETNERAKTEQRLRQAAIRLKKEKRRQAQLKEEHARAEERTLMLEKNYGSLEQEIKEKDEILRQLSRRLEAAESDSKDLEQEFEEEREGYQRTVRELQMELAFQRTIVSALLTRGEVQHARQVARYNPERGEWRLPPGALGGRGGDPSVAAAGGLAATSSLSWRSGSPSSPLSPQPPALVRRGTFENRQATLLSAATLRSTAGSGGGAGSGTATGAGGPTPPPYPPSSAALPARLSSLGARDAYPSRPTLFRGESDGGGGGGGGSSRSCYSPAASAEDEARDSRGRAFTPDREVDESGVAGPRHFPTVPAVAAPVAFVPAQVPEDHDAGGDGHRTLPSAATALLAFPAPPPRPRFQPASPSMYDASGTETDNGEGPPGSRGGPASATTPSVRLDPALLEVDVRRPKFEPARFT